MSNQSKMDMWLDDDWGAWASLDEEPDSTRLDKDVEALKARFAHQGFSLTTDDEKIMEGIPTWCTGTIGDKVFHFRFRMKEATMRVGTFDVAQAESVRSKEILEKRNLLSEYLHKISLSVNEQECEDMQSDVDSIHRALNRLLGQNPFDHRAYPNVVEYTARRKDVTNERYSSFLIAGMASNLIGDMLDEAIEGLSL